MESSFAYLADHIVVLASLDTDHAAGADADLKRIDQVEQSIGKTTIHDCALLI